MVDIARGADGNMERMAGERSRLRWNTYDLVAAMNHTVFVGGSIQTLRSTQFVAPAR
jgi:hypothetical protein